MIPRSVPPKKMGWSQLLVEGNPANRSMRIWYIVLSLNQVVLFIKKGCSDVFFSIVSVFFLSGLFKSYDAILGFDEWYGRDWYDSPCGN